MRIAMMAHHPTTVAEKLRLYAAGLVVEELPPKKARVRRTVPPDPFRPKHVARSQEPHDDNPPPED